MASSRHHSYFFPKILTMLWHKFSFPSAIAVHSLKHPPDICPLGSFAHALSKQIIEQTDSKIKFPNMLLMFADKALNLKTKFFLTSKPLSSIINIFIKQLQIVIPVFLKSHFFLLSNWLQKYWAPRTTS